MRALCRHLTYANVVATLALLIAVGGGAAYAANTVFSSDIVNDEVRSADVRDDTLTGGGLAARDLRANSVSTSEVVDDNLRSEDILDGQIRAIDVAFAPCGATKSRTGRSAETTSPTTPYTGRTSTSRRCSTTTR